jgi:hypothetical protein
MASEQNSAASFIVDENVGICMARGPLRKARLYRVSVPDDLS